MINRKILADREVAVSGEELFDYLEGLSDGYPGVIIPLSPEYPGGELIIQEWKKKTLVSGRQAWVKKTRKDE